jgi:hypothetical protein
MKNRKGNGNIRNVDSMKKVTQCIAIRNPTNVNVKKDFKGIRKVFSLRIIKKTRILLLRAYGTKQ